MPSEPTSGRRATRVPSSPTWAGVVQGSPTNTAWLRRRARRGHRVVPNTEHEFSGECDKVRGTASLTCSGSGQTCVHLGAEQASVATELSCSVPYTACPSSDTHPVTVMAYDWASPICTMLPIFADSLLLRQRVSQRSLRRVGEVPFRTETASSGRIHVAVACDGVRLSDPFERPTALPAELLGNGFVRKPRKPVSATPSERSVASHLSLMPANNRRASVVQDY